MSELPAFGEGSRETKAYRRLALSIGAVVVAITFTIAILTVVI